MPIPRALRGSKSDHAVGFPRFRWLSLSAPAFPRTRTSASSANARGRSRATHNGPHKDLVERGADEALRADRGVKKWRGVIKRSGFDSRLRTALPNEERWPPAFQSNNVSNSRPKRAGFDLNHVGLETAATRFIAPIPQ
jgi:hypothetical protein